MFGFEKLNLLFIKTNMLLYEAVSDMAQILLLLCSKQTFFMRLFLVEKIRPFAWSMHLAHTIYSFFLGIRAICIVKYFKNLLHAFTKLETMNESCLSTEYSKILTTYIHEPLG